ncbi:MAG: recombinase family protein [Candidatus Lambdaproteobacteria bacterium]|nr:recombinase family protein [Candidatus Lambdaproteobacteria bacterium]
MKVIGYTSHNTLSPQPKNLTLDDQEQIIRNYVAERNWELVDVFSEIVSTNSSQSKTKLDELIDLSATGAFDMIVVPRLDRLTRNIRQLSRLVSEVCGQHRVGLISIEEGLDSTADNGRLAMTIIDILAKWDTKRISDRTREIIARKRSKGERVGHAPFGFTYKDKMLVTVQDELDTVRLIREKRDAGMSYHKIAKYLNDRKIASKRGGIWYAETVKTVFQNSLGGKRIYQDLDLGSVAGA